jgi:hypothetical protein
VVVKFLMMDYLLVTAVLAPLMVVVKFLMMDYLLVTAVLVTVALDLGLEFVMRGQEIFRLLI